MILTVVAMGLLAAMPQQDGVKREQCALPSAELAAGARFRGAHRLSEELDAAELLAVQRKVGGCNAPLVVRTGIGAKR